MASCLSLAAAMDPTKFFSSCTELDMDALALLAFGNDQRVFV